jgi:iron(III) transport system substrate-binding protein
MGTKLGPMRPRRRRSTGVVALLAALAMILAACGGEEEADTGEDAAADVEPGETHEVEAPDDDGDDDPAAGMSIEEIEELAREEGEVVWYTPIPTEEAEAMAAAFEDRYGISVNVFRAGGEQVLTRLESELITGNPQADVVGYSNKAAGLAHIEGGHLASWVPPETENVIEGLFDPDGYWITPRTALVGIAYNTDLVSEEDAPTSWLDLLDDRFSGQTTTASPEYAGMAVNMTKALEQVHGWDFFTDWANNGAMVVQGYGQTQDLVIAGERLVGTAHSGRMATAIESGQPVDFVYPEEGAVLVEFTKSVLSGAPNPYAARLFLNWTLTEEAQEILVDGGYHPSRVGMDGPGPLLPLDEIPLVAADQLWLMDEANAIELAEIWIESMGDATDVD